MGMVMNDVMHDAVPPVADHHSHGDAIREIEPETTTGET